MFVFFVSCALIYFFVFHSRMSFCLVPQNCVSFFRAGYQDSKNDNKEGIEWEKEPNLIEIILCFHRVVNKKLKSLATWLFICLDDVFCPARRAEILESLSNHDDDGNINPTNLHI